MEAHEWRQMKQKDTFPILTLLVRTVSLLSLSSTYNLWKRGSLVFFHLALIIDIRNAIFKIRFFFTTDFSNLEAKIIEEKLKRFKTSEKRIYRLKMSLHKAIKNIRKAMIFHRMSNKNASKSQFSPYSVGWYNKEVSQHPYCFWKLPYCIFNS